MTVPADVDVTEWNPVATVLEPEGRTLVVPEETARAHGLNPPFRAAWISLSLASDLADVGLTAAFSAALGDAGIPCNVMAGAHHDHLFVLVDAADRAVAILDGVRWP